MASFGRARGGAAILLLVHGLDTYNRSLGQVNRTTNAYEKNSKAAMEKAPMRAKIAIASLKASLTEVGADTLPTVASAASDLAQAIALVTSKFRGWGTAFKIILSGYLVAKISLVTRAIVLLIARIGLMGTAAKAAAAKNVVAMEATTAATVATTAATTRLATAIGLLNGLTAVIIVTVLFRKQIADYLGKLGDWTSEQIAGKPVKNEPDVNKSIEAAKKRWKASQKKDKALQTAQKQGGIVPGHTQLPGTAPGVGTHNQSDWQSANAIDISTNTGSPVLAPVDSVVVRISGSDPSKGVVSSGTKRLYGYSVTLRGTSAAGAADGVEYFIAHLARIVVKVGQHVKGRQVIAYAGSLGHVHFAVSSGSPWDLSGYGKNRGNAAQVSHGK